MHQGWLLRISCGISLFLLLPPFAWGAPPAPISPPGSINLQKTALTISYNTQFKLANWVFYSLGADELHDCYDRNFSFRADPDLDSRDAAEPADYKNSGYDRGHLSPAGDNKWSEDAMKESFLLSNVSPQPPAFNRGVWSRLENLVRAWASGVDDLWVTTGPLLDHNLETIGDNGISVPEYFYKVLATKSAKGRSAIAFLLPVDATNDYKKYEMSVAQLQTITGLDFLHGVPGEKEIEGSFDSSKWDLKAKFQYAPCEESRLFPTLFPR